MMDIYVDIGNTHTVFGIVNVNDNLNSEISLETKKLIEENLQELRFSTKNIETAEDIYTRLFPFLSKNPNFHKFKVKNFIISSVVPQINFVIDKFVEKYTESEFVCWIEPRDDIGINWQTEDYKQMGADRVADILGGICLYNDNFAIIDFGTAITIDVIVDRKYVGGSISPGFMLLIKSLFQETAKLPMVELKPIFKILDNTTIGQIQLGTVDIMCRGINSIIYELKNKYKNLKVILTGGFSNIVKSIVINDEIVSKLQFVGMKYYLDIIKNKIKVK